MFSDTWDATAWVKNHKNASKDAANKDGAVHLFTLLAFALRTQIATMIDEGLDPELPLRAVDVLRDAEAALASNVNLKHALENLAAQWTRVAGEAQVAS